MNPTRLLFAACMGASAPLAVAQQAAAPAAGADDAHAYVAMCTGCHGIPGYQSSFPKVYHVPKLGGQSEKYLEAALHEYKRGERSHPTMQAIAAGLTDKQIAAVAAYYAARGADQTSVATK